MVGKFLEIYNSLGDEAQTIMQGKKDNEIEEEGGKKRHQKVNKGNELVVPSDLLKTQIQESSHLVNLPMPFLVRFFTLINRSQCGQEDCDDC